MKNIKQIAREVLITEGEGIKNLAELIDNQFEECVKFIFKLKGRVVITGIGKSAIIAQKIVATMNSTGTPALFMHAADAIHGDLGMIQNEDIVICISKSGNSPEIKVLAPLIKRRGSKLVAMVSNINSDLAKQADFVLNATVKAEACPNNLAPTTSTSAHMALGDALAVALLELRGFSSEDFAHYHPGGTLGKQLYLKVEDLMVNNGIPTVRKEATLKEVILEISSKRLGAAAVLDQNNQLLGIITDGDLRRMLEKQINFEGIMAENIMGNAPKTIDQSEFAVNALQKMQENNIMQLVVTNNRQNDAVVGFIHMHDLLREGIV